MSEDFKEIPLTPELEQAWLALLDKGLQWGAVAAKTDEEHVHDFVDTLRITREDFSLEGPRELHGVYIKGTGIVICHTGTSPNSALHAQLITGVLMSGRRVEEQLARLKARIAELEGAAPQVEEVA